MLPRVVHWDNHMLAIDKPSGWATQGDRHNERALESWARDWIRTKFSKPGAAFAHPIHRLDKDTSGLVIFAKSSKALSRLVAAVRNRVFKKGYLALVEGSAIPPSGQLENWLIREDFFARVADKGEISSGQRAHLAFVCLARRDGITLLALWPSTGRYHQIRVQLATRGWPICGDVKYGARAHGIGAHEREIFLHHGWCCLPHPITQCITQFTAPVPESWPRWCSRYISEIMWLCGCSSQPLP